MRKDRKSINIMMIIIVLVSIIGIGANIFLIHNDKEKNKNTIVGSDEIEDKPYVVGTEENTIQAMNNITPEASITDKNTQAATQETEEQGMEEQNTMEQNIKENNMVQKNETQNAEGQDIEEQNTTEEEFEGAYYINGASSVNIRSAAHNKSKVVGWLAEGTEVEMIRKDKYYSYIKHGNMEGYVYNEYIIQK